MCHRTTYGVRILYYTISKLTLKIEQQVLLSLHKCNEQFPLEWWSDKTVKNDFIQKKNEKLNPKIYSMRWDQIYLTFALCICWHRVEFKRSIQIHGNQENRFHARTPNQNRENKILPRNGMKFNFWGISWKFAYLHRSIFQFSCDYSPFIRT